MDEKDSDVKKVLNEIRGYYFEAYSSLQSHEVMIKDRMRTMAYKRAIEMNKHLFEDKIVLDVGCGLGILSLFAASAGAKTVIGIDASDIVIYTQKVIESNKFKNIIIINSKVEEVTELPNGINKVDVIISEWMGVCLYHESMLGTVLYARDKWLKKEGILFPDKVCLYIGGFDDTDRRVLANDRWSFVHGFNMNPIRDIVYEEPSLEIVMPDKVMTNFTLVSEINLKTASRNFAFSVGYNLIAQRNGLIGGFVAYFDAIFTKCHKPVVLSTSPLMPSTHWRQTVFYFRDQLHVQANDLVSGKLSLDQYKYNFRDLEITINVKCLGRSSGHYFTSKYILR